MGMSHETCEHPRTPAGRAWCRANGGPGSGAVWGSLSDNEPTVKVARTGARKATTMTDQEIDQIMTSPKRGRKSKELPTLKEHQEALRNHPSSVKRRRAPEPKVNITDLPRIFRTAVDWAKANDCVVNALPGRNNSVRVQLTRTNVGTLTLTYSHATPEGVHAISWRPVGTSVASRLHTVNEGLANLKGGA